MTGRVYRDYQRDRVGWFFGLTGLQLGLLAGSALPVFWAVRAGWWSAAFVSLLGWIGLLGLIVVPVRGRSATGWLVASVAFALARLAGQDRWSSRLADGHNPDDQLDGANGPEVLERPDLPPALDGLVVHHSTRLRGMSGLAVVQHGPRAGKSWVVVARLEHHGLDWLTPVERDQHGAALAALLDAACRTELVSEVQILVRTGPDAGADREHWLAEHRNPTDTGAGLARTVHDDLRHHLTPAATRTETFLSLVVPDTRLRRRARQDQHGRPGRRSHGADRDAAARSLLEALAVEVGDHARAHLGLHRVDWLTSPALAEAVRTGFHPDVDTALADARAAARASHETQAGTDRQSAGTPDRSSAADRVEVGVSWAVAGPAHAQARPRSYVHDGWESASVAVLLPARGAPLGALTPVLSGGGVGERRCLLIGFPVVAATVADRVTASREWGADLGDGLRARAGVRPRAKARADQATARGVDAKLVAGAALTRPYAIATTTILFVPASDTGQSGPTGGDAASDATAAGAGIGEATRGLEASVRRAGFGAQRLDLAHDTAFAAGALPLGRTLGRGAL